MKLKKFAAFLSVAAITVTSLCMSAFANGRDSYSVVADVSVSIDATKNEVTNYEVKQIVDDVEMPMGVDPTDVVIITYTTPASDTKGAEIQVNGLVSEQPIAASTTDATVSFSISEFSWSLKISAKNVKISRVVRTSRVLNDADKNDPTTGYDLYIENVKIADGAETLSAADKAIYKANVEQIKSIEPAEVPEGDPDNPALTYILTIANGAKFTNIKTTENGGNDAPIAFCIKFSGDPSRLKWKGKEIDYAEEKRAANEFAGTADERIINFWAAIEKGSIIKAAYVIEADESFHYENDLIIKVVEESPYEPDEGGSDKPTETTTEAEKPAETTIGNPAAPVIPNIQPVAPDTETPKDVISAGAVLEVKEQSREEAIKAIESIKADEINKAVIEAVKKAVEEAKAVVADINLIRDGQKIQPDGTVKVTINIPEAFKNVADLFVYRAEDNGTFTLIDAKVENGKIVFFTNHFSTYIITSEALSGGAVVTEAPSAAEAPSDPEDKNQNTGVFFAVVPAAIAAAGVAVSKRRK